MTLLRTTITTGLLLAGLTVMPTGSHAQQNIEPKPSAASTVNEHVTPAKYTREQLMSSTVHQAWLLSGKSEENFFDMVQELAGISAANRGITLPDSEAAGRRMGDYIKRSAKMDTDQLLYAVVDKAVLMTSKTPVHAAGAKR